MRSLDEFGLIARYFTRPVPERQGVGDDCALIDVGATTLALTTDMLVEGVHFFPGAEPDALGHKCLAVNLSDLAAAGARPRSFLLGLALPAADPGWLEAFSRGLFALAQEQGCHLIGGDTVRAATRGGPLTVAITAIGEVDPGLVRGRAGARPGDDVWVSGWLGEAALALAVRRGELPLEALGAEAETCFRRMDRPQPRVALGRELLGLATAAADVSDGLVGDLGHILERSGVGADVVWEDVPRAPVFAGLGTVRQQHCILAGGDDYELVFTAAPENRDAVLAAGARSGVPVSRIGRIDLAHGLRLHNAAGDRIGDTLKAFNQFPA